jgi:ABC-type oligopeptide transport system ATPase subunit
VLADQFKQYCVPQVNNNGISIQLDEFFHPNFPYSVKNSLDYVVLNNKADEKNTRFVFVSGPNGSGKSAIARAILASLVANQTFGFVSAQKGTLPLFDKIYFAANLSDDLGVASKFQVELAKLKHLHQYLEKNPEKKVLLVMDEPLTTTDSAIAGKVLFNLFTFLKQYPNLAIISISNNSTLKDFKGVLHMGMVVETNEDGTFKPTYKCKEGHSYISDVMAQFVKIFGNKFCEIQEDLKDNQPQELAHVS